MKNRLLDNKIPSA